MGAATKGGGGDAPGQRERGIIDARCYYLCRVGGTGRAGRKCAKLSPTDVNPLCGVSAERKKEVPHEGSKSAL